MASSRASRLIKRVLGWAILPAVVIPLYLLYRWAGSPSTDATLVHTVGGSTLTVRLENAPFTGYADGHKSWSLWARTIDLERPPDSSLANIQSALLTDIRDGILYKPPTGATASAPKGGTALRTPPMGAAPNSEDTDSSAPVGPPAATFQARQGRYTIGMADSIPPDLALNYNLKWQFKLTGSVDLRTSAGDRLQSPSLAILDLRNRRTRRPERRMICDEGAEITLDKIHLHANQMRYDPTERTVECLGGVRGALKDGVVQAERLFWSLKDQVIRCPETATGVMKGIPFTAEGMTIDMKHRVSHANHISIQLRREDVSHLDLP
jgi:hypothetical protein